MTTSGIQGLTLSTHNWGRSVAFWQRLGYRVEFDTGHGSGQLRHPDGGPYLFVVEVPPEQPVELYPVLGVGDAAGFRFPDGADVERPFEPQHWGVEEALLLDPDGRRLSLQAPLRDGAVGSDHE